MGGQYPSENEHIYNRQNKNSTKRMQNLKLLCINVCGLLARLRCPEFVELLQGYDIIGIQESKTDDTDNIYLPGYTYTEDNRCKMARIKSGGIGLFVKDTF